MYNSFATAFALLRKTGRTKLFCMTYLAEIAISIMKSYWLLRISKDNTQAAVVLYIVFMAILPIFNNFTSEYRDETIVRIERLFKTDEYKRYDRLSFSSSNKSPVREFNNKLRNASRSIESIFSWGVNQTRGVLSSIISCVMIFWGNEMVLIFLALIVINVVMYKCRLVKLHSEFFTKRKKFQEQNQEIMNLLTLLLPLFQYKQKSPEYILEKDTILTENQSQINKMWKTIDVTISLTNVFGLAIVCYTTIDNNVKLLLLINSLGNFTSSIHGLMNFMNQFQRLESDFNMYQDFWKELEYKTKPREMKLANNITITSVNISRGNFQLRLSPANDRLVIKQGSKILVKGPSGHGKSTFINALMGKIDGVELLYGKPENFFHCYVEMYQTIKESLPTSQITIRQLFDDEKDDELIWECCRICCVDDWLEKFGKENENKNEDSLVINITKSSPLDMKIQEKISGGQKTRLAMATRIHQAKQKKNRGENVILIFDEPEQGSDPEVAYQIINNIMQEFRNETMYIISHLELIHQKYKWDNKLYIKDGLICLK